VSSSQLPVEVALASRAAHPSAEDVAEGVLPGRGIPSTGETLPTLARGGRAGHIA